MTSESVLLLTFCVPYSQKSFIHVNMDIKTQCFRKRL